MKHEELLAKINENEENIVAEYGYVAEISALRAVVELHKPVISALPDETCLACQDLYPCPTIQVIEKELQ